MNHFGPQLKRIGIAFVEYLLGFLALAIFAALAFGKGTPTDERMVFAFKIGAGVAAVELAVLLLRSTPTNRLILGANVWLMAGGAAALLE
jgi:hypothetical protein